MKTRMQKKKTDTIIKRQHKVNKAFLDGKVKYKAEQYAELIKEKTHYAHDKAELYYQDIELKAGIIVMDYEKKVYAGRIKDSTGKYTIPNFKQGANE
jgi:hypothetical protein